jgi:hypothetical protein
VPAAVPVPTVDPARFDIPPQRLRGVCIALGLVFGVAWLTTLRGSAFLVMLAAWLLVLALPSRAKLARQELARRQARFREVFQNALTAGDRSQIEQLPAVQKELVLEDGEIVREREGVEACLALYALEDQIKTSGLRVIPGYDDVLKGATCHFAALAFFEKRGPDETAMLLLSAREAVFDGNLGQTRVAWAKVARVTSDGSDILIQRADRQTPYCFRMGSLRDAKVGAYIATILHAQGLR